MSYNLCANTAAPAGVRVGCGEQAQIGDRGLAGSALSVERRAGLVSRAGLQDESPVALRILFLVSAHNGLSQRAWVMLTELGHEVTVAVVDSPAAMESAVARARTRVDRVPVSEDDDSRAIWAKHRCLVVHPGPQGDRGPSSLDWAVALRMRDWGVTVLEANEERDAGGVWATRSFRMRELVGKSSLYRHEVRRAAMEALGESIAKILDGGIEPQAPEPDRAPVPGRLRPLMTQDVRAIDWSSDCTDNVLRKLRAGEGHPGVLDSIHGREFHLFGAHRERVFRGNPGELIAQRDGAICRATIDGAVWITHLKRRDTRRSAISSCRLRARLRSPASTSTCRIGRRAGARTAARRLHLPRDRLRGGTRRSATCALTSTTAR